MAGYTQVYDNGMGGVILRYNPDPIQLQQQAQQYQQPALTPAQQNELSIGLTGQDTQQVQSVQSRQTSEKQITDMVDAFHKATYRWGTDDDVFEAVLNDINENNIIEVSKAWNKYHGKEKGESFYEAFFEDATRSQLEEYGPKLARALRDRAEAAGCYDELAEDFAKIEKQFEPGFLGILWNLLDNDFWGRNNDWLTSDENIGQIFDRISNTIVKAEAAAKADAAAEEEVDEEDQIEAGKKVYADEMKYTDSNWTTTPIEHKYDWESVA